MEILDHSLKYSALDDALFALLVIISDFVIGSKLRSILLSLLCSWRNGHFDFFSLSLFPELSIEGREALCCFTLARQRGRA